jgi:rare lipoprotein A
MKLSPALAAALLLTSTGCLVPNPVYVTRPGIRVSRMVDGFEQRGTASFYGPGFQGRATANGEIFDMNDMTCAHRTLPFGTVLLVRNLGNGREATVRVNDRGPYVGGRIVDLSRAAAGAIGMLETGTAEVLLRVVGVQEDE